MTFEEQLIQCLKNDAELSALVGDRIYPMLLPENPKLPAVTFRGKSEENFYTLDGPLPKSKVDMEFSCWSLDYFKAKAAANKLKNALHACRISIPSVQKVEVQGTPDEYFPDVKFYQSGQETSFSLFG